MQTKHDKTLVELKNYQLLVETVEDYAIFMLDIHGNVMTWNRGAERNKGYTKSEIVGQHFSVFYSKVDRDAGKPALELEIAQKVGRVEDEDWRVRKDGSRFWANVVITALFNESGTLVGFAKVTRDLTERKRNEDDLRMANKLLRAQQKELKALNASKDEFISLASHQLRTPATGVKQLLGLLLEGFQGKLQPNQLPLIQKAYEANDRQIAIVNSLLQVAQVDSGKVVLKKSKTDVTAMLQSIINELSDTFVGRNQTVLHDLKAQPVCVEADPRYLRMAFENLIDNASKYTFPGGTITVTASQQAQDITVSITDTGVGIPQEALSDLFQKFKRIPNELSQTVSGSGLGLYWVNQVIHLHGGHINVSSKPTYGTTFAVHIPGVAHSA